MTPRHSPSTPRRRVPPAALVSAVVLVVVLLGVGTLTIRAASALSGVRNTQASWQAAPGPPQVIASAPVAERSSVVSPAVPASPGAIAVSYAEAQVGKPYVFGGVGPVGFDCAGLVQKAWAAAGVALPRTTIGQWAATRRIGYLDLEPGDLVFFYAGISHVGIYVGNGLMVDAPHTGAQVHVAPMGALPIVGFGRVPAG